MLPETVKHFERLCKERRIKFVSDGPRSRWPEDHRRTLGAVVNLGESKFDSYANDIHHEPWKAEIITQACTLVQKAECCKERSESSWRLACEPLVFARLEAEKVCNNRMQSVWRSEIEASCDEPSSFSKDALRELQHRQQPCRCSREPRTQDHPKEVGMNQIFGHCENEAVALEEAVANAVKHRTKKPDAIYGLRPRRHIEELLHDTRREDGHSSTLAGSTTQLHELLNPSPIKQNGEDLLFPFLVLEAKSSAADCSWHSIQMQTAFPIKTFLDTQNRLQTETGGQSNWPLVWFFANRGEDWRVSAACLEKDTQMMEALNYRIIEVWRGSIEKRDGALQLLLIVDYIFDWARDVYRPKIITELESIASVTNDAASIIDADTDIYSTRQADHPGLSTENDAESFRSYYERQTEFIKLDSASCVVRHASFVESVFCCILITPDNARTALDSIQKNMIQPLLRLILSNMSRSTLLDLSALNDLEERWTGHTRISPPRHPSDRQFFSVISCTTYISTDWHLVRELCIVAIAEDAWGTMLDASLSEKDCVRAASPPPPELNAKPEVLRKADTIGILNALQWLQTRSLAETLLAAITRRAIRIEGPVINGTSCETVSDSGEIRQAVQYIYEYLKKGVREVDEPFCRASRRFDQTHLLASDTESTPEVEETLKVSQDGCVLISSSYRPTGTRKPKSGTCVYFVRGEPTLPTPEQLFMWTMRSIETRDVYHTTQDNGQLSHRKSFKAPWNIRGTYGICSGIFKFLNALKVDNEFRKNNIPVTQGSRRPVAESGSYLSRNILPWYDPRHDDRDVAERIFIAYKIMTHEIVYWKTIAKRQTKNGIGCCQTCAAQTGHGVCVKCSRALLEHCHLGSLEWVRQVMQGEPPFALPNSGFDSPCHLQSTDEWRETLSTYPELNDSFKDLRELEIATFHFRQWHRKEQARRASEANRKSKREHPFGERRADDRKSPKKERRSSGNSTYTI